LQQLIKNYPDAPEAYFRLGQLQRSQNQYDMALEYFNRASALNPLLMDVFSSKVYVYAGQKKYDQALQVCDEQMKAVGDNAGLQAVIHQLKGNIYYSLKQKKDAVHEFELALQANPDFLKAYYALAQVYLQDKEEEKAILQYQKILEKEPGQVGPHMLLGILYEIQRKFDLSETHYRKALEIQPDFAPAANNLAYLLASQDREMDVALGLAQKAKEKQPDNPAIMDTLGWIFYKKGMYDAAIAELKASVEKIPENASVRYHLGLAYMKKGEKALAKKELAEALRISEEFDGADDAKKVLSEL
ncbi:MAG: tetratricopeptide repeat protein, partial [Deltaproteobacteria bacterium]